jgi:hypothetical protein
MSPTKKSQILMRLIAMAAISPGMANADAVQDWNAILWTTTAAQNPFLQARFAAITHLAMFEAVNAITGDYQPYLGTVAGTPGSSAEAAAVAAAHRVLSTYFPGSALTLDAARATSLAAIPDGHAETDGLAVGEAAAAAMIANRANDGSAPPQFYLPVTADPGEWQPTTGCPPSGGVLRHWPNVAPFGLRSGDQFRSAPPPALTSVVYATDLNEVKALGSLNSPARPQDRTNVAQFYAASPPTFIFSQVFTQTGNEEGWSLSQNARAFALLMMAISDSLIASQDTKYHYRLWRPVTAIHGADTDGNALTERDAAWQPLITSPCFPSYQSAHATGSNAARRIAERLFDGEVARSMIVSNPAVPGLSFHYKRFSEITTDIDDARVYGGIHFRFDQKAGARQGQRVADYIFKTRLRPSTTLATSGSELR